MTAGEAPDGTPTAPEPLDDGNPDPDADQGTPAPDGDQDLRSPDLDVDELPAH
jgi:hypothetical protein